MNIIKNKAIKKYKNLFFTRKSNLLKDSNLVNIVRNINGMKYYLKYLNVIVKHIS